MAGRGTFELLWLQENSRKKNLLEQVFWDGHYSVLFVEEALEHGSPCLFTWDTRKVPIENYQQEALCFKTDDNKG